MSVVSPPHWITCLVLGGSLAGSIAAQTATPSAPFFDQYCIGCHSAKVKSGGLALDAIMTDDVTRHPDAWEKVVRKLQARYMPPAGLPRPDERAYNSVVDL